MTTLTPYLCVHDGPAALAFYRAAFGAVDQGEHFIDPSGRVGHAELRIQGELLMVSDEHPEIGVVSPKTLGGTSVGLYLDCPDVDKLVAAAVQHGATLERPVEETPYGTRSGTVVDPFGHRWHISTLVRDVSDDDMKAIVANYRVG